MDEKLNTDPSRPACIIYHGPSVPPDDAHADRWRNADELFA